MGYGLSYRMKFTNLEGYDIVVLIQDTTTYSAFAEEYIKELTPTGDPLHISITDNNEDKFTSIRAKKATIKILSDININVSLFALNSTDNRWLVDIYVDNPANPLFLGQHIDLFSGFLVLADLSQPFLDDFTRREIVLTASDGIGLLKDVPLTKPDNTNPKGDFKIIEFISWCLQKTGLQLPINVMNNLMEESLIGLPAYNNIYIASKTFEDKIGVSLNCYEVLKRILGEECFLVQINKQWWVRRIDEYENNSNYYDSYDSTGLYLGTSSNVNLFKNVGLNLPIQLIAPATLVRFERPFGNIKENFNFNFPKEIIDNIDFSRGGVIFIINPGPNKVAYTIDDWTVGIYLSSSTPGLDAAYIVRTMIDGYEKDRYVRLKQPDGQVYYIKSNPLAINAKDKFSISVDTRLNSNISGSGFRRSGVMQVRLYGSDGTNYFLHGPTSVDPTPRWVLTNSTFSTNTDFVYVEDDISDDETEWISASCEAPAAPIDGDLVIWLINWGPNVAIAAETHFQNLQFDYIPYINNSYAKYNGQYNKISQSSLYKAQRETQVYLSDAPLKIFAGALLKKVAGKSVLAGKWVNGALTFLRTAPVDNQYKHLLGFIQAYSVWNQFRREMRLMDCNIIGLDSGVELPDLMHSYFFTDHSAHTDNKKFMLIHYDMDLYRCRWRGFFAEVYDNVMGKAYNNTFEFKYVENR